MTSSKQTLSQIETEQAQNGDDEDRLSPIAAVFELPRQLGEDDAELELAAQKKQTLDCEDRLRHRDREIGLRLPANLQPAQRIIAWLEQPEVRRDEGLGSRIQTWLELGTAALFAIGVATGALTTAQALRPAEGEKTVEFLPAWLWLVGLPLLGLSVTLLLLIPNLIGVVERRARPLLRLLPKLSPDRVLRWLTQRQRGISQSTWAALKRHRMLYEPLYRFMGVQAWQLLWVGLEVGMLLGMLYSGAPRGLAFTISTTWVCSSAPSLPETRQCIARRVHVLTHTMALPFTALVPVADPSIETLQEMVVYRTQDDLSKRDPVKLGRGWEFLALCVLLYGLLPRLGLYYLCRREVRRRAFEIITTYPGVDRLLSRIEAPLVETRASAPEPVQPRRGVPDAHAPAQPGQSPVQVRRVIAVSWCGAKLLPEQKPALVIPAQHEEWDGTLIAAGGQIEDDEVLGAVRARSAAKLLFLVNGIKAPQKQDKNFLMRLREALGTSRPIWIVPLDPDPTAAVRSLRPEHELDWKVAVQELGDPWTDIRSISTLRPTERGGKET